MGLPISVIDRGPRWAAVFARLLQVEGGFVDSPDDPGGATKYGLSLRFLAQTNQLPRDLVAELEIDHEDEPDLLDIEEMTIATASDVYFEVFWPIPSTLPQPLDAAVFDQTVNDGQSPAIKLLQLALNSFLQSGDEPLAVDGVIGPAARAAISGWSLTNLLAQYRRQAAARYTAIAARVPSEAGFLDGWLNRAAELGNV